MKKNAKTIAFFRIEDWQKKIISKGLPKDLLAFDPKLPSLGNIEIISIFVNFPVTAKVLGYFPKLKFITTRSTGFDHIDLDACKKAGVKVAYVPGYGDNTVAEFAFGLLLSLTRKLYSAIDQIKETGIFSYQGLEGVDLKGKIMGIIGTGRIGKEAINIAKGFGMKIVAFDVYPDRKYAKTKGFEYVSLSKLLNASDAISIHVPYSKATHHLINSKNISKIKKGAFLVNTARGGIVETDALVKALERGILAGAALDVLEEEGEIKDEMHYLVSGHPKAHEIKILLENHVLMKMPNVLITPHNAFNTKEALERILHTTIENIKAYLAGKPINLVNR